MRGSRRKPQRAVGTLSRPPSGDYAVGFGKPPVEHRFAAGRSGNPGGRPKGARNKPQPIQEERLKSIVLAEAYRLITVNDAGKPVEMPVAEAILRTMSLGALKGHHRSQRLFTELLASTERSRKAEQDQLLEEAIQYKEYWEDELARRLALRIVAPDPVPHPDDVIIDLRTGTVDYAGPLTPEEKRVWDKLRLRQAQCEREIADLPSLLAEETDNAVRAILRADIDRETRMLAKITQVIGKEPG